MTHNGYQTPFSNVAGSLLQTLQSAQPSIQISWLSVDEMTLENQDTIASQIEKAYTRMLEGEDEILRETRGSEEAILPDYCLSAFTGLSFPYKERDSLGEVDYSLGFATPRVPIIISYKTVGTQLLSRETIDVCVKASVLANDDLQLLDRDTLVEDSRPDCGFFFAGSVQTSQDPEFSPGSRVVGWHPDHIHRNRLGVHHDDMWRY